MQLSRQRTGDISPKRHTNAQWFYRKMLSVINYYRNVNQNHKDILLQTYQDCKEKKEQQGLAGTWQTAHIAGGSRVAQPLWKAIGQLFKTSNIETSHNPTLPLLEYTQKKWKYSDTCSYIFTATWGTTAKRRKQCKRPLTEEWINTLRHYMAVKWTTT